MLRSRVFLSYAREDQAAVKLIYQRLQVLGLDPWMDIYDLPDGAPFERVIPEVVRRSRCIIVFLSTESLRRDGWRQKEVAAAREAATGMPPGTIFILPARLDGCVIPSNLPRELRDASYADLYTDIGFEQMIVAMRSERPAVATTRFFTRWFKWGFAASAGLSVLAALMTQLRTAPLIAERIVVGDVFSAATGLSLFWLIAGWRFRRSTKGWVAGLAIGGTMAYLMVSRLDLYPMSDVVRAFSLNNPSGDWSYGFMRLKPGESKKVDYVEPLGFQRLDAPSVEGDLEGFFKNDTRIPAVLRGTRVRTERDRGFVFLAPSILDLHPGYRGERAAVRWTAPDDGTFRINGYFIGLDTAPTSSDASIVANGQDKLFRTDVESFGVPIEFSLVHRFEKGQFLDFLVGWGSNGNANSDSTGLVANIRLVR